MLGCFENLPYLHLCAAAFSWYSAYLNSVLMHGKNKEYYLADCIIFPMVQELWNTNQHSPTAPDLRSWLSAQTEPKALSSGGLSPQEGTWECISANKAAGCRESSVQFEGMSLTQKLCSPVSDKAASSGDHAVVIKLCGTMEDLSWSLRRAELCAAWTHHLRQNRDEDLSAVLLCTEIVPHFLTVN